MASSELRAELKAHFADLAPEAVSEAELAQAALDVLGEDPEFTQPIQTMLAQSSGAYGNQKYIDPTGIALTTAAILVLQMRLKLKADSTGKWSIEIDKKNSSDGALKLLVQRLLSFLDK